MAHERILLIDDSFPVRELVARHVLPAAGYDVLTASSGTEGLTLARDLLPDLIIIDYSLPGMNGLEVFRALQAEQIHIPMILMTGEGSEALAIQALRAGVSDYLVKPVGQEDLLQAIRRTLSHYWVSQIKERLPAHLLDANRKLERRYREMSMLLNIGASVASMLDLEQVLNHVVESAVMVTNAEAGSLMLIDWRTGELYMRAARNYDQRTVHTLRIKVEDSIIGQVIRSGEPLVINENEVLKVKTSYFVKSAVYVPIKVQSRGIGVLAVDHRLQSREFDPYDIQLLSILANFAAVAIENARLHADTIQERDTLDAILRDTDDYVIVIDTQDHVLFCNATAREAFKVTATDFLGKPLTEVIQNSEVQALFQREARIGRSRLGEITLEGGERTLNAQLTIIEGIGRAVVMQDITRLKKLDRAKSEFVATVAHDLRSPLTAVLGYAELLQRASALSEQQQHFTEQIVANVHSITELITELLELSKIESEFSFDLEPVDLGRVVEAVLRNLEHQISVKQHTLSISLGESAPPVFGNTLRLRQMCANLIGNAVKYTPPAGRIEVAVWSEDEFVCLRVADNGIGIAVDEQPYIFDKFYRTARATAEYEGTGLGLSIVKSVIDQHAGRIWLNSKDSGGTVFTVMLPRYDPEGQPSSLPAHGDQNTLRNSL